MTDNFVQIEDLEGNKYTINKNSIVSIKDDANATSGKKTTITVSNNGGQNVFSLKESYKDFLLRLEQPQNSVLNLDDSRQFAASFLSLITLGGDMQSKKKEFASTAQRVNSFVLGIIKKSDMPSTEKTEFEKNIFKMISLLLQ